MKQYWLSLNSDTFIWTKGKKGLVYNTKNSKQLHFCNEGVLKEWTDTLLRMESLYRVTIDEASLTNSEVRGWIDGLMSIECAQLVENDGNNKCPVSLKPELKVQDSVSYYKIKHNIKKGGDIMTNLHRLVFHLNGSKFGHDEYSKQIIYPMMNTDESLEATDICDFILTSSEPGYLQDVSLVGCIWQYEGYERLISFLQSQKIPVSVYCMENDYKKFFPEIETCSDLRINYHVLISDYKQRDDRLFGEQLESEDIQYDFIVTSESDLSGANELIDKYGLENYHLYPVYTGNNSTFLEECLYLEEEDIKDICLSKREIFARQVLNTNFFGILTISPDGTVFAGKGMYAPIGNVKENLYTIVYREITEGNSWFRIRNQEPCSNCVYQFLCPSPSVYERVIGKPNLCHIKHD